MHWNQEINCQTGELGVTEEVPTDAGEHLTAEIRKINQHSISIKNTKEES
jgi:hypothetical protein